MAAVNIHNYFGVQENKICHVSNFSPSISDEVMGPVAMILVLWMLSFKPAFSLSSFTLIKRLFIPLCFLPLEWCHLHIWGYWYFSQQFWFQLVSQPGISHDVLCIKVKQGGASLVAQRLNVKQGDNIQLCCTPFSNFTSPLFHVQF